MPDAVPVPVPDRPRFDFLHGLRGLAALAIVLFHATLNAQGSSNPVLRALQQPLLLGYLAVSVFLVLSGFLLAVPVVTHGFTLRGGIGGFLRRRAIRILPPYYAAYVVYLLFFAAAIGLAWITGLDPGRHVSYQREVGFGWSSVAAHLLLIHNASIAWVVGMDAILWSIACEWQIYLLFALVLVPVWRRAGSWAMLAVAAVAAAVIIEGCARGWWMYFLPWMIPIFAIGALAAGVVVGEHPAAVAMRRWRWGLIAAVTAAVAVAGVLLLDRLKAAEPTGVQPARYYDWSFRVRWIYDVLAAVATASFVTWLAVDIRHGGGTTRAAARARSLLESRPLFTLGLFSYSLYLTHGLVVVSVVRATNFLGHAPTLRACVVMVAAVAISLAFAYVFYLLVERRCMSAETRAMFTPAEADRPGARAHPARPAAAASARPPDAERGSRP